jgi:ATP-binding protein involved in chromosome partitioning
MLKNESYFIFEQMSILTKEYVKQIFQQIEIPGVEGGLTVNDIVTSIVIKNNNIGFVVEVEKSLDNVNLKQLENICIRKLKANITALEKVTVVFTGDKPVEKSDKFHRKEKNRINNVKKLYVIASCKGGVGKSTVTVGLAHALTAEGKKVGIVDADIYGPSIPHMLGNSKKPKIEDNKMVPVKAHDIETVSTGLLFDKNKAAVWRGPMATKALYQLVSGTKWSELDCLLIDLPPGTGDISLSLAENYKVDGVILVSTPQEVALLDVKKTIDMFKKIGISIVGLVENMSYFIPEGTSKKIYLFGKEGAKQLAAEEKLPFLGEIPLSIELGEVVNKGKRLQYPELEPFLKIQKSLCLD